VYDSFTLQGRGRVALRHAAWSTLPALSGPLSRELAPVPAGAVLGRSARDAIRAGLTIGSYQTLPGTKPAPIDPALASQFLGGAFFYKWGTPVTRVKKKEGDGTRLDEREGDLARHRGEVAAACTYTHERVHIYVHIYVRILQLIYEISLS